MQVISFPLESHFIRILFLQMGPLGLLLKRSKEINKKMEFHFSFLQQQHSLQSLLSPCTVRMCRYPYICAPAVTAHIKLTHLTQQFGFYKLYLNYSACREAIYSDLYPNISCTPSGKINGAAALAAAVAVCFLSAGSLCLLLTVETSWCTRCQDPEAFNYLHTWIHPETPHCVLKCRCCFEETL